MKEGAARFIDVICRDPEYIMLDSYEKGIMATYDMDEIEDDLLELAANKAEYLKNKYKVEIV